MNGFLRETRNRMPAFLRKEPLDHELEPELSSHLDFAVQENVVRG